MTVPTNTTFIDTSLDLGYLLYTPFSIICGVCTLVSIGSYMRDKTSFISSNCVALWAPFELLALGV